MFYTYLHCKPDGSPFYVGKGVGKRSNNFSKRSIYHKNIIKKYGKENIKVYIFECTSETEAFSDEIHQIAQLRHEGYLLCNLTDGGEGTKGLVQSPEHTEKIRLKNTGKIMSEETRKKMSLAKIGKTPWNKGLPSREETKEKLRGNKNALGIVRSEEFKKKISETKKKNFLAKKEKHK